MFKRYREREKKERRVRNVKKWTTATEVYCANCHAYISEYNRDGWYCWRCGTRLKVRNPTRHCCIMGHEYTYQAGDKHCQLCGGKRMLRQYNPEFKRWDTYIEDDLQGGERRSPGNRGKPKVHG